MVFLFDLKFGNDTEAPKVTYWLSWVHSNLVGKR
jgi:hypothetical protein